MNSMKRIIFTLSVLLVTAIGAIAQSPYINRVYEYRPAPGQFVNEMPSYEEGDTPEDMARKAEECIAHDERVLISLGSYGGYVTFGFDHMIENRPGKMDFQILGNAFYSNANPNPNASKEGGSCEPGIVMVSHDANGNGEPDDAWYELAGSEYDNPTTVHNYRITYYRPDEDKERTPNPDYKFINDTSYVRWTDNMGNTGHGSHSGSKPGTQRNDEHGTAKQRGCHDHDDGDPGRSGDGAQELDNGINPVTAALGIATGDAGDQAQDTADEITQEQQIQGMDSTLKDNGPFFPEGIGHEVQTGNEGLGQNTSLQSQIVVACQQQEQSSKQRCAIALLVDQVTVALVQSNGGHDTVNRIGSHQNVQEPLIDKGVGITALIRNQLIFQNSNQTTHKGQEKDEQVCPQLKLRFLLSFQFQQLLSGQILKLLGVRHIG